MKSQFAFTILFFIFFLLFFLSFDTNKEEESKIDNDKIVKLIRLGEKKSRYINKIDSIGKYLNKILLKRKENTFILCTDSIDSNGNIFPNYHIYTDNKVLRDLYVFSICILNKDTLIVNNNYEKLERINYLIHEFYKEILKNNLTKRELKKPLDYFNTYKIAEINFLLITDIYDKKGLTINEWKLFFNCLKIITDAKNDFQNEIALNYFGKTLNNISFLQKQTLIQYRRFSIVLNFNMNCKITKKPNIKITDSSFFHF